MPELDSQNAVVFAVVVTAVVYLISRSFSVFWRKRRGCDSGCASCPVDKATTNSPETHVISAEQLANSGKSFRKSE
jgi:hypothetical protein